MKDYFLTIIHPMKSFNNLLSKPLYFKLSFIYILIPVTGYTLMYIFLTIGKGAPSVFTPWLNIPLEQYYAVNRFLLAPSLVLAWFAATSVAQVCSRLLNGSGTFEQTLAVIALSISISMWGGLIHDLPMSFCSAVGIIDAKQHEIAMNSPTIFRTLLWIAYSIYFFAFITLFTIAINVSQKLSMLKSFIIGMIAFVVFQLMFLVFNR